MTRPNVLPSAICTASAPRIGIFRGSMAGLCAPLSTLRRNPRGQLRMTRGRCGSLLLHRKRLALSTPCRSPGASQMSSALAPRTDIGLVCPKTLSRSNVMECRPTQMSAFARLADVQSQSQHVGKCHKRTLNKQHKLHPAAYCWLPESAVAFSGFGDSRERSLRFKLRQGDPRF